MQQWLKFYYKNISTYLNRFLTIFFRFYLEVHCFFVVRYPLFSDAFKTKYM